MRAKSAAWDLAKAAISGAAVGPLVILMNLHFQGLLAKTPVADLAADFARMLTSKRRPV